MDSLEKIKGDFQYWEKTKDLIDQLLDIILNYRQSGHPGGSRSKVHAFLMTTLSGAMRWDLRDPGKRFADRFVLGAGHTVPLIYTSLAVFNEALKLKYERTGDKRFLSTQPQERILTWEDLLGFRHRGGLSGHAEASGKTLFLKFNTGPSGHGSPAAAGIAVALKRAKVDGAKVFIFEGEGGLTPGATHETANSAWGLALDNLYYMVDWNDYGIDDHKASDVVYGTPEDWFAPHGWRVFGAENGSDWESLARGMTAMMSSPNPDRVPSALWFKTRKGRGYGKYDNASHGAAHPMNSEAFWQVKKEFADKYGVNFVNMGGKAPADPALLKEEFRSNLKVVMDVLASDTALVDYLAERLVEIGDSVPEVSKSFVLGKKGNPFKDKRLYDFKKYPEDMWAKPGTKNSNRAALAQWGAWANAFGKKEYDRPLFIISSADLSGSTNISGFASDYGDTKGYGWYERVGTEDGIMLPQEITEFSNAGILAGLASVNMAKEPEKEFEGFWGATSTYGSFSYLLYGPFRLFSQLAQDCEYKTGKVLWIAGHSGPETAEDSRTHFGVFSPGVTQFFPKGKVINLHPWEYNDVPVLLAAAFSQDVPIIALHLTRPNIEIPDRKAIGMAHHYEAARGAYLMRDYKPGEDKGGTIIVQGTGAVSNMIKALPELDRRGLNVKIVVSASAELFEMQDEAYKNSILSPADQQNSTVVTTSSRTLMLPWLFNKFSEEYALSPDWDNNWRTGGSIDEVLEEAHLSPDHIADGIERFVKDRNKRLETLRKALS
ncbi:transketolase-like TK C-terminal-containing protein [Marispirochaeta aestuarii]|uniref:transketolase-like TK C-terminal-containing protein n=1 Tax=Marispirochaeta aestuarii TaxID=1963862 RepID=UPI0018E99630|nr:transketolase [Marispirochaeta aestuarii]